MLDKSIPESTHTPKVVRRIRPLVLIDRHGKIEEFASISAACKAHSALDSRHISDILDGNRQHCRGFSALDLDVYRTLNSDGSLPEKFFRPVGDGEGSRSPSDAPYTTDVGIT